MAVFRGEKTHDYTVMANHHLRDISLSLKAKGLLSLILSLPDDWSYTMQGLSAICKDGIDGINSAIHELEQRRYVTRRRIRNDKGQLTVTEYTIWEAPQNIDSPEQPHMQEMRETPILESPKREKPILEKPTLGNPKQANPKRAFPAQANPMQLNTNKPSTENNHTLSPNPSIHLSHRQRMTDGGMWRACENGYGRTSSTTSSRTSFQRSGWTRL